MTNTGAPPAIDLYPEDRDCPAPSAARILDIFADHTRHLHHHRRLVQVFQPNLQTRLRAVLRLLAIPPSAYQHNR